MPAAGWGRVEWVLARPRYRFRRFDLTGIPGGSRAAALDLQLRQWSPYPHNGYHITWDRGAASVFCWDAEQVAEALAGQGLKPKRVRILPETVLCPPGPDGARIIAGLQGFEGQIWSGGQLLRSRWWRELPSREAWLVFQRDAGLLPEAQQPGVPAAQSLNFLDVPWGGRAGIAGMVGDGWRDERLVYLGLALLLGSATSWYAGELHSYQDLGDKLQTELARLQEEAGPLATARGEALQSLTRIQQLRGLDPYPHQLELMAWAAEKLLRPGDRLVEWNFQKGKLKLVLSTEAEIQSSALVHTLQSSGLFGNVRSTPNKTPKHLTLEMDVLELNQAISPDRG